MIKRLSFFTCVIFSAFLLAVSSLGNAAPIVNSDSRGPRSMTSTGTESDNKETTMFSGNRIVPGSYKEKNILQVKNPAARKKLSKTRQQRNESSLPDVIPKDPNGFFHPASLNRFKSSVASFKHWQHLNVLPDATTLARTKAEDVALELDYFIDKIATPHHPHTWQGGADLPHLQY
ncbi:hypothetical protein PCASD_04192 [Puccinia coronata f. sp. avenae]|uniref:RxLR effector protein n=1 Tax=Puccinia coronata f. sp. avenae TaxID=200324 RepID=A0A2N5V850_9BASI|nr:hypothetical protein PCASD_04192 [Puccinia coronata f. sp. avenae]